jgi:anaerobic selenocysteine-containing dehydrogenase
MSKPIHDPLSKQSDEKSHIEVKNTTCYMCACRCGIRVTLRDGEVRYIQGNPDHPLNKGVICAKGSSGIMKQYSPARLTKPLLRKPGSDRGDNDFDEISWEKAYEIMTERMSHLRGTDPKKLALFTGRDEMESRKPALIWIFNFVGPVTDTAVHTDSL